MNYSETEKKLLRFLSDMSLKGLMAWRHNIDPEDETVWGLAASRLSDLALHVARHLTGVETIPYLEDKPALPARGSARTAELRDLCRAVEAHVEYLERNLQGLRIPLVKLNELLWGAG